jgi:hypothetical protein
MIRNTVLKNNFSDLNLSIAISSAKETSAASGQLNRTICGFSTMEIMH